MKHGYFITGTDTGIGKTFVSCALLSAFARQGFSTLGMKPIAAGCKNVAGELVSEDAEQLVAASTVPADPNAITPYAFEPAIAPHLAARHAGIEIKIETITVRFTALQNKVDIVIVEGVGGFCVPLNTHQNTADMAVALGLPVILVVGMRLGCLNHALLSTQAVRQTGLPMAGWIANCITPDMPELQENIATLETLLPCPRIATLPFTCNGQDGWKDLAADIMLPFPRA